MNTAVQQDTKLVPINQKLSDQQLKKEEFNPNTETKDNKNLVNSPKIVNNLKKCMVFNVNWDEK